MKFKIFTVFVVAGLGLYVAIFAPLGGVQAPAAQVNKNVSGFQASFPEIPAGHMTQSEAHMSVPALHSDVQDWFDIENNTFVQRVWNQVVARERQFNDTHYVFYTGFTSEWRVPQDLYLKLYTLFHPLSIDPKTLNLRLFRWLPVDHLTPRELIKQQMLRHGMLNDTIDAVKAYLLSANLALFGNVGVPLECSFWYFLTAQSHTQADTDIFKGILDIFGISHRYVEDLQKLRHYLRGEPVTIFSRNKNKTFYPQSLSQIFVPKSIVDDVAYVAWTMGVPYDEQMVAWVMGHQSKPKITKGLKEMAHLFKDKQAAHPLFQRILKGIEDGKYRISTMLNEYKAHPEFLPGINNLQARLIATPKYLGSLGSSVEVYDYDTISKENKVRYETELDALVLKMFKDFLMGNEDKSEQAHALDDLANAFNSMKKRGKQPAYHPADW